jgi:hypothetical protein
MAVITKGITLSYKVDNEYVELDYLQSTPELGGDVEAIEITCLKDSAHIYTDGLISYGDSLAFKFLYEAEQFLALGALKGSQEWKITLPDGETCSFGGSCSVKLDGAEVGGVLSYTLNIKPNTEMVWA